MNFNLTEFLNGFGIIGGDPVIDNCEMCAVEINTFFEKLSMDNPPAFRFIAVGFSTIIDSIYVLPSETQAVMIRAIAGSVVRDNRSVGGVNGMNIRLVEFMTVVIRKYW
jgi:hypothetical protein